MQTSTLEAMTKMSKFERNLDKFLKKSSAFNLLLGLAHFEKFRYFNHTWLCYLRPKV